MVGLWLSHSHAMNSAAIFFFMSQMTHHEIHQDSPLEAKQKKLLNEAKTSAAPSWLGPQGALGPWLKPDF